MAIRPLPAIALILCACASWAFADAAKLQTFQGAKFTPTEWADGDSFRVSLPGPDGPREEVLRLYFADCPESSAASDSDRRRVIEQSRYFGLDDPNEIPKFGHEAAAFVRKALAKPFTVHTAFAKALGRSNPPRIYAMITTSDGKDLAATLVRAGLARTHGIGRQMPDGTSSSDYEAYLHDLEIEAVLGLRGIWAKADPERLAELRATQRREDAELKKSVGKPEAEENGATPPALLDINSATVEELSGIRGVGPALAQKIIESRPISDLSQLKEIPGIGPALFERITAVVAAPQKPAADGPRAK